MVCRAQNKGSGNIAIVFIAHHLIMHQPNSTKVASQQVVHCRVLGARFARSCFSHSGRLWWGPCGAP